MLEPICLYRKVGDRFIIDDYDDGGKSSERGFTQVHVCDKARAGQPKVHESPYGSIRQTLLTNQTEKGGHI